MTFPAELHGNWRLPSSVAHGEGEFLHVSERGRIVHFTVYRDSNRTIRQPMAVWAESQGGPRYRIRIRLSDQGALIELKIENDELVIINTTNRYTASRVSPAELPAWFPGELDRVMQKMDRDETSNVP